MYNLVTEEVNMLEALRRSQAEAERRSWALVIYGLYYRIRRTGGKGGKGKELKRRRGKRGGGGGREGRGVGFVPSQAKGEERRREIRAVLERVERLERGSTSFTVLHREGVSVMPLPALSSSNLDRGERREDASELYTLKRVHIGLRRSRMQYMAESAGEGGGLYSMGEDGRYTVMRRQAKRRRVEEGADMSGVT